MCYEIEAATRCLPHSFCQYFGKYLKKKTFTVYTNILTIITFFQIINRVFVVATPVHYIFKTFDGSPSFETRGVFLDISKAFDKVWHEGLLFKLRSYGVQGCLYNIIKAFLKNRKQRVVLNGQNCFWENVNAGVPQGSILGPLLFLIYINDLPGDLNCVAKLFADDTSIFSTVSNITKSANDLNKDLCLINE